MLGVQFDKKDIVRVDKSSALPQLAESLWMRFQKVTRPSDGGDLDIGIHREWHFDDIYRVLNRDLFPPPLMWKLGVYLKIYSRAMSSQCDARDSSAALRKVRCFWFHIISSRSVSPSDPAWLWQLQISWQGISHSSGDFDWLVDYLNDVCSNDHETAGDILVLLSSMRVSCSPAKQHLYIEKLIACMGSSMPPRLRHAALLAAHSSREVLASIDVVDGADMVLTKFSPAILTAVRPQPGATPTDDGPDCLFHPDRDLCYLELIFALAENWPWKQYLLEDGHISRCRSIVARCRRIDMYTSLKNLNALQPHAFYLAGIFLRVTSGSMPPAPLRGFDEWEWEWERRCEQEREWVQEWVQEWMRARERKESERELELHQKWNGKWEWERNRGRVRGRVWDQVSERERDPKP
ncbi:hypothetical protein F4604DRAFT_1655899, partial [Suillus subluteus]